MQEVRVELQTTTALFLAGVEPRGAAELRAPSLRGALRYWLRAALGGVLGDDESGLRALREAEARVFGSTEERWGGASAVTVRLHGALPDPQPYQRGAGRSGPGGRRISSGRDFLYWSMPANRSEPARFFYPSGGRLEVQLVLRPPRAGREDALRRAAAALWLLVNLGGLGSRSRRTAGSLSALQPMELAGVPVSPEGRSPAEVAAALGRGLTGVRALFRPLGQASPRTPSDFDLLHPRACRVWVLGVWPTAEETIEVLGGALRDFRGPGGGLAETRGRTGGSLPLLDRAAFGLPLKGVSVRPPFRVDRRASPLWLTVSRTAAGSFAGVATLFASRFLEAGATLTDDRRTVPAPESYPLLERFAEGFPQSEEVPYE